ncbi:hypothetical protein P170DRAFT_477031 [Aspergillus steynii IBT 23096]|uniref:BTB domain-containing protein n=1 Tax=Aspergillus steynii IBT 23096 TaxID=1392250 RepID=A0A2I2G6B1_9EURO|nr:uncharacterized protein P170DRAFT_477031 [Aspergillus steynii IBT 23096]PLB48415.1 hypothetical protein P170DRAFT_477031 [Aspergillus steynii IBT 23096]
MAYKSYKPELLMCQILQPDKFSDLTFTCRGRSYRVHKSMVFPQSPVIEAACSGLLQIANDDVVEMSGFDIETVETMIEYLYTSNYTVSLLQETSDASENNGGTKPAKSPIIQALIPHLKMFNIANHYQIDELKQKTRDKIQRTVTKESYYTMSFETARFTYKMTNDSEIRQSIARHIVASCSAFNYDHTWSELTKDALVIDVLRELTTGLIQAHADLSDWSL